MKALSLADELDGARRALDAAGIRRRSTAAPAELPDIAGQALAWVVREGATNVLRHSGAASCRFELTEDGGQFRSPWSTTGSVVRWTPARGRAGSRACGSGLRAVDGGLERTSWGRRVPPRGEGAGIVIRILLAEDQAMMRGALAVLLGLEDDLEVVAQVGTGAEIVPTALEVRPDVALLDIELPGRSAGSRPRAS